MYSFRHENLNICFDQICHDYVLLPIAPSIVTGLLLRTCRLLHGTRSYARRSCLLLCRRLTSSSKVVPEVLLVVRRPLWSFTKTVPEVSLVCCWALASPWCQSLVTFDEAVEGLGSGFCACLKTLAQLGCRHACLSSKIGFCQLSRCQCRKTLDCHIKTDLLHVGLDPSVIAGLCLLGHGAAQPAETFGKSSNRILLKVINTRDRVGV